MFKLYSLEFWKISLDGLDCGGGHDVFLTFLNAFEAYCRYLDIYSYSESAPQPQPKKNNPPVTATLRMDSVQGWRSEVDWGRTPVMQDLDCILAWLEPIPWKNCASVGWVDGFFRVQEWSSHKVQWTIVRLRSVITWYLPSSLRKSGIFRAGVVPVTQARAARVQVWHDPLLGGHGEVREL